MRRSHFAAVVFGTALCLSIAGVVLGGGRVRRIVEDFLSLPECAHQLQEGEQCRRELELRDDVIRQRIDRKARIVQEVIREKWPLREAVAAFREVDRTLPTPRLGELATSHGDEESYGRAVILWVSGYASQYPDEVRETLQRLEKELEALR